MRKLTFTIVTLVLALITNLSGQNQTRDLANIDEFITDYMESVHKPGLSACIIKGDSIIWRGNYGFANLENSISVTKDMLFNAYSIGKSITAASIMKLWEDDLIDLDENVNNFLPFQINNPFISNDSITPRMLMTHTSSIIDFNIFSYATVGDATMTLQYFLENYLSSGGTFYNPDNFSNNIPGTHYQYSNTGSALNGFLAEVILNEPFKDYVADSLLDLLQMSNTTWFLNELNLDNLAYGYTYEYVPYPQYGHPAYPGLTMKSSSEELAQYVIMLMNSGNYMGNQILEETTVDTMCSPQMNLDDMGLGLKKDTVLCANEDKIIWGHKGGSVNGFAAEIQFCPDENIGVVYMSNSNPYADEVLKKLFEYGAIMIIPKDATNISESGFTANWQEAPDAVEYYLDVSYDWMFSNYIEGYENLNVALATSYNVLTNIEPGISYFYRIRAHNGVEMGPYSTAIQILITGMDEFAEVTNIDNFQCYPIPLRNFGTVSFELKTNSKVTISLFNKIGQSVLEIYNGDVSKGEHNITFNTSDIPSGMYFLRMKVGDEVLTKKIVKT